jgi:hypothetical protein
MTVKIVRTDDLVKSLASMLRQHTVILRAAVMRGDFDGENSHTSFLTKNGMEKGWTYNELLKNSDAALALVDQVLAAFKNGNVIK